MSDEPEIEDAESPKPASTPSFPLLRRFRRRTLIIAAAVTAAVIIVAIAIPVSLASHHSSIPTAAVSSKPRDTSEATSSTSTPTASAPAFATQTDPVGINAVGANAVLADADQLYSNELPAPATITLVAADGQTAKSAGFAVEQLPQAPTRVAIAATITTTQTGLKAASTTLAVETFDGQGTLVKNAPLPASVFAQLGAPADTLGTDASLEVANIRLGNGIAVIGLNADDPNTARKGLLVGMEATTGAVLWTEPVPNGTARCMGIDQPNPGFVGESAITANGLYVYTTADSVIGVDLTTGANVWTNPLGKSCNYYISSTSAAIPNYLIVSSNGGDTALLSTTTGKTLTAGVTSAAFDPVTGQTTVSYETSAYGSVTVPDGDPALEVFAADGSTVFSLPAKDGIALGGLSVATAFDGRVWIHTPAGYSIIDSKTGQEDPISNTISATPNQAGLIPTGGTRVWTLLGGDPNAQTSGASGAKQTLVRHPAGQITVTEVQTELSNLKTGAGE